MEMNAGTSHRHAQLLPLLPLLQVVDSKEIPPQVEVGANPQESLAQGDKRCNVLDPIGGKVLQLHLVVIQQPPKERVSRYGESSLMEVSEGHNIPFGWQRLVLIIGQPPLLGDGQRAKEATANEALQALRGGVGFAPRLH